MEDQLPTVDSEILGVKYTLQILSGTDGWTTAGKLTHYLIGPFGQVVLAKELGALSKDTVRLAMIQLTQFLAEPAFVEIVKTLCKGAKVDGKPMNFDLHWARNFGRGLHFIIWACRENFTSFFDGSHDALDALKGMGVASVADLLTTLRSPDPSPSLIARQWVTLRELRTYYSLVDVMRLYDLLVWQADAEAPPT